MAMIIYLIGLLITIIVIQNSNVDMKQLAIDQLELQKCDIKYWWILVTIVLIIYPLIWLCVLILLIEFLKQIK